MTLKWEDDGLGPLLKGLPMSRNVRDAAMACLAALHEHLGEDLFEHLQATSISEAHLQASTGRSCMELSNGQASPNVLVMGIAVLT